MSTANSFPSQLAVANQTTLKMYDEKARIEEKMEPDSSEMNTPETSKTNPSAKAAEIQGSSNSKHQKSATQRFGMQQ